VAGLRSTIAALQYCVVWLLAPPGMITIIRGGASNHTAEYCKAAIVYRGPTTN